MRVLLYKSLYFCLYLVIFINKIFFKTEKIQWQKHQHNYPLKKNTPFNNHFLVSITIRKECNPITKIIIYSSYHAQKVNSPNKQMLVVNLQRQRVY